MCILQNQCNLRLLKYKESSMNTKYDQLDCTNVALVVSNLCNTKYHICIYWISTVWSTFDSKSLYRVSHTEMLRLLRPIYVIFLKTGCNYHQNVITSGIDRTHYIHVRANLHYSFQWETPCNKMLLSPSLTMELQLSI